MNSLLGKKVKMIRSNKDIKGISRAMASIFISPVEKGTIGEIIEDNGDGKYKVEWEKPIGLGLIGGYLSQGKSSGITESDVQKLLS